MRRYFRKFEGMKKIFVVGLVGFVMLTSVSCKEDPMPVPDPDPTPTVRIDVQPVFNGNDLFLDSTYTTTEGYKVQFTDIKFYLEDVMTMDYTEDEFDTIEEEGEDGAINAFVPGLATLMNHHSELNNVDRVYHEDEDDEGNGIEYFAIKPVTEGMELVSY